MKALAGRMKDQLETHDRDRNRDRFGLKLTANGWGYPVRYDDYEGYKRGFNDF